MGLCSFDDIEIYLFKIKLRFINGRSSFLCDIRRARDKNYKEVDRNIYRLENKYNNKKKRNPAISENVTSNGTSQLETHESNLVI